MGIVSQFLQKLEKRSDKYDKSTNSLYFNPTWVACFDYNQKMNVNVKIPTRFRHKNVFYECASR